MSERPPECDYAPALRKTNERINKRHGGAFLIPPPANDGWESAA